MTNKPTRFLIVAFLSAVAAAAGLWASPEEARQRIVGLNVEQVETGTTVVIEADKTPLNYTYYSADLVTFVVEFIGAEVVGLPEVTAVESPEIAKVKVANYGATGGNARFLLIERPPCTHKLRLEGSKLYVEVRKNEAPASTQTWSAQPGTPNASVVEESEPAPSVDAVRSPPPAERAPAVPATILRDLAVERRPKGLVVDILGDGYLLYNDFLLEEPDRLVIDFKDVANDLTNRTVDVSASGVAQIRSSQFQESPERIARVVFDLDESVPYRLQPQGAGLRVVFGEVPADPQSDGRAAAPAVTGAGDLLQGDTLAGAGFAFSGALAPYEAAPEEESNTVFLPQAGEAGAGGPGAGASSVDWGSGEEYTGEMISLDFKDADVKDVLRFFSEISGLNIILDPEVAGNVTVRLTEVPWDQALDIILRNQGYGKALRGNVLRIAPHAKLASEEKAERDLRMEQELNTRIITTTRPISYARAEDVKGILDQVISQRGSVLVDERTNTLVIREVEREAQQKQIRDLINILDEPTPQVEIEARIVETTKQFERSLGVQWGFSGTASAQTGTTTDFTFPNNYKVKGDLLASDSGLPSELPNSGWAVNLPVPNATAGIGLHFGNILDTLQLDLALTAAESDGYARTLSAPKITTQNNQNASIESGFQIPIQTTANQTTSVTFVSASLQLQVTPQITSDNTVIMTINVTQDFPNFALAVLSGGNAPINTRRASTQVLVADGATTVIGGIFQFAEDNSSARVPFLGKLPLVKYLFHNSQKSRQNTELLIFITPHIKKLQR